MKEGHLKNTMDDVNRCKHIAILSICPSVFTHCERDTEDCRGRYQSGNHVGKVSRYEAEAAKHASCLPSPREVVSGQSTS